MIIFVSAKLFHMRHEKTSFNDKKVTKSLWSRRKSVILQPKPKTSNENVIYSIYNMVVASLKIEKVVSNEAV